MRSERKSAGPRTPELPPNLRKQDRSLLSPSVLRASAGVLDGAPLPHTRDREMGGIPRLRDVTRASPRKAKTSRRFARNDVRTGFRGTTEKRRRATALQKGTRS